MSVTALATPSDPVHTPITVNGPTVARSVAPTGSPPPALRFAVGGEVTSCTVLFQVMTELSPAGPCLPAMQILWLYFGTTERSPYESPPSVLSTYTHSFVTVFVTTFMWAVPANARMVSPPTPPTTTSASTAAAANAHLPRMCPPFAPFPLPLDVQRPMGGDPTGWARESATV